MKPYDSQMASGTPRVPKSVTTMSRNNFAGIWVPDSVHLAQIVGTHWENVAFEKASPMWFKNSVHVCPEPLH